MQSFAGKQNTRGGKKWEYGQYNHYQYEDWLPESDYYLWVNEHAY